MKPFIRSRIALVCSLLGALLIVDSVNGNPLEPCDPTKIITSGTCVKCHAPETEVWKNTAHFRTFDALHRTPQAKSIAQKMGVSSIKRSTLCTQCHYTTQAEEGSLRTVAGVSCESCHGAARDWFALHNDYGGPTVTRQTESPEHRASRVATSIAHGMRNPTNLYLVARSCLGCHTVPHEKLVNVGGHTPGSAGFDLVAWSQGTLKHNFLSHNGRNVASSKERLREMYVIGLVAELEWTTRATAEATQAAVYGNSVAQRAARVATQLFEIQATLKHPLLEQVLVAFREAELRTNNREQLLQVANELQALGVQLADALDGRELAFIDALLPSPSQYK